VNYWTIEQNFANTDIAALFLDRGGMSHVGYSGPNYYVKNYIVLYYVTLA